MCALATSLVLGYLLYKILAFGLPHVTSTFLTEPPSYKPERAGIWPGIMGTAWIGVLTLLVAVPVGVAAAIYLNEFARDSTLTTILRAAIANLAGVPSVVFGILGLAIFVRAFGFGASILAAGLTLALLVLPIVIVAAEEALKTVPRSMREAAFALGASRWQVVRHHVLPYALPGVFTGGILALARAVGETAPLVVIGAAVSIRFAPEGLLDPYTALPIQAYYWAEHADPAFHELAWATIFVLVALVLVGNLAAILLRDRFERKLRW